MQTTTAKFDELQAGGVRPHGYNLAVSFDKQFDPDVTLFTLNTSVLDGPDVLAPVGNDVITEWQKYVYADYTDRVVGLEWTQETSLLTSIMTAIANVEVNNYDRIFTRGAGGPLDAYLMPRRPLRIQAGFSDQLLPQLVGVSEGAPKANRASGTATFAVQDFLRFIFDRKLDQTVMIVDKRVDEILTELFSIVGVLPDQMILDEARTTVPFAFFQKDQTLGSVVNDLMKAEMGSLYMDEQGFIVFKNRLRATDDPVITLDASNVIDYRVSDETQIINSVRVRSEVREVQANQPIFVLYEVFPIEAGQTVSKFFNFEDPVTTVDPIDFYTANYEQDGSGADATGALDIASQTNFNTSILVEFENTGSQTIYVTSMTIYGTPAKVVRNVDILEKDQASIDEFEEQVYEVNSPYIQDVDTAESIALTIVRHFKDYGNTLEIDVKSNPALQIGDLVTVDLDDINDVFRIIKKVNVLNMSSARQTLTVQRYEIPTYFVLNQSQLNGTDVLAA